MMPSWAALQPSVMARQLSILWAYRYDQETGQFVGRLAGDKITQILGRSIRGVPMENVFAPGAFEWAYGLFQRVACEPAIYLNSGRVFGYLGRLGVGESIILPLSSDGVLADGILGATEYPYSRAAADTDADDANRETWYGLRTFSPPKPGTRIEPPPPVGRLCGDRQSYGERASEMIKLAEIAATEETRAQFLNLAQQWDRLAQTERSNRHRLSSE